MHIAKSGFIARMTPWRVSKQKLSRIALEEGVGEVQHVC